MKITKEQFIKAISQIQNFRSQQDTINQLIDKITDGFAVVDVGNYLINEIVELINTNLNIEDTELIFWWLYDTSKKIIYTDDKSYKVETIEELWDYIQEFYK